MNHVIIIIETKKFALDAKRAEFLEEDVVGCYGDCELANSKLGNKNDSTTKQMK